MDIAVEHFDEALKHLPLRKRRELARVVRIIFEEFDAAQQTKLSAKKRAGRILKIVLFGSYARGDWVEDRKSGYRSDYDILVVVNDKNVAEEHEIWQKVSDHFLRELTATNTLKTPTNVIVNTLHDINDQLSRGKPFLVDLFGDGVMLFEEAGHPLAKPKPLTAEEARVEAQAHFDQWFPNALEFLLGARFYSERYNNNLAAFSLHQAAERLYHCVLLVVTLYSPKSHRLKVLRSAAERIEPRLVEAWPRDTKVARRMFEQLDRAYVEARYSARYHVSAEELQWLLARIAILENLVKTVCEERLSARDAALPK